MIIIYHNISLPACQMQKMPYANAYGKKISPAEAGEIVFMHLNYLYSFCAS